MELSTFVDLPLFILAALIACRKLDARERRVAMASFGLHVLFSIGQWSLNEFYYELGGDAVGYRNWGILLSRLIEGDFLRYVPEVLKVALHMDYDLPFEVNGSGHSTATMSAIAGMAITIIGSSMMTLYLFAGLCSWYGQLCIYQVARAELEPRDRPPAVVGIMLIPSAVVWGAIYSKESFVLAFLGILIRSTWRLLRKRHVPSLVGVVVGSVGVGLLKPYTLFAWAIALPAFIYADRAWRNAATVRIRPLYLVLAVALALGGVATMGQVFPSFSTDKLAESLAAQQGNWQAGNEAGLAGGSYVEVGSAEATTASQQLAFAPAAFVNAFFRPFFFEARGAPALGAAVESTVLTVLVLQLFGAQTRRVVRDAIVRTPLIVFSIAFCLTFGVVVGLASSNLGSLSRYRMPMMPFYATIVLILRARGKASDVRRLPAALEKIRRSPRAA